MSTTPERARGLLLEGVVVVLSILLAFFLDGWRKDRELARDLKQELVSVRTELQRNRQLVELEIDALSRITTAGAALSEVLASTDSAQVTMPDTLGFLGLQWHPTFSPSLGAVEALIASGRLAQVRNPELRLGLAGLNEAVNDALEEEVFARQVSVEQLLPLVGAGMDYRPISRVAVAYFGLVDDREGLTPQERASSKAVPTEGSVVVPNSPAIRSAALRRHTWLRSAGAEFAELHEHLGDLITLISEEIR